MSRALSIATPLIAVLIGWCMPFVLSSQQESLLTRALIFGLMAAALDVAYGHSGLYSLGHAALAGVGGYTAGLLMVRYDVQSFWVLMLAAGVAATIASTIFALIALRARHLYFILVTLALAQAVQNLAQQWDFLKTSQAEAVTGIIMPDLGVEMPWDPATTLQFTVVVVAVLMLVIQRLIRSPLGLSFRGTRENEVRMEALGYHVWRYRMVALILSGQLAGLAGAMFAFHSGLIAPTNVGVAASGLLVLMVIIGGTGTRYGPFVGGILVTFLLFYASDWSLERSPLIIGAIFILTALLHPYRTVTVERFRGLFSGATTKGVPDAAA